MSDNECCHNAKTSATDADWSREQPSRFWDPGRKLLKSIRDYQRYVNRSGCWGWFVCRVAVLRHRFWSLVTGADIPLNCQIGGGLLIPHPNGIVIHPDAQVGVNCLILQQVTLGDGGKAGLPVLQGHVDLGAGSKVLGGVVIGAHTRIGANAVVTKDLPAGCTAVGVPARVISVDPSECSSQ